MISRVITAILNGFRYATNHPQILFVLVFLVVLPLLFLFVADRFLEAGRLNQDRLQKDRVGLMQDSFVSMLKTSNYDAVSLQDTVEEIAVLNPDITKFRITKRVGSELVPVAALNEEVIGVPEEEVEMYRTAAINSEETLIVSFHTDGSRVWQAFRFAGTAQNSDWFVFTELSLASIDSVLKSREREAQLFLVPVFVIILLLVYWQFRNTDYRYLYLQAEEANKTRDLFTNMITHELRAPLTAMRGYASLIEEEPEATTTSKEHASRLRQSTERLLGIVNDLLEVARIQSGRLTVATAPTDLSGLVQTVLAELSPSAATKGIELRSSGTNTPLSIHSDEKRLHQVIVNLVSNAIKYTEQGSIEVAVTSGRKQVEIRVKDTGMGISAADQKKLFAPFFRVSGERMDGITGTGLGMWITKELIDALGGTVGVESIKGVGTNVVVTFPIANSNAQANAGP